MLLSLSRKFIFIANLKSASSAIERALRHTAEFSVRRTEFGKHDSLSMVSQKFPWVRRYVPYEQFFVFGVLRDPIDFLVSLYNSHNKDAFDGMKHSTKDISFDQFLDTWCLQNWQARPQHMRFSDDHGRFRVSHLMDYAALSEEFPQLLSHIGLAEATLTTVNASPEVLRRSDLTLKQVSRIRTMYAADYELLLSRPRVF